MASKVGNRRRAEKTFSRLDLDAVVFDGDRDLRRLLMEDEAIRSAVEQLEPAASVARARRELLLSALRLTPGVAPDVADAIERITSSLQLDAELEVYCLSSPDMQAFVVPPHDGRVLMGLSSTLLEKMAPAELAFVLGHELGHVLYGHFELAPPVLLFGGSDISPLQATRLYAWMRYAELSADRIGLLCCQDLDAAIRAFFKLTSGLCDERYLANAREAAKQLAELSPEAMKSSERDWFETHPYGPLRIRAIDLFARSSTYSTALMRVGGDLNNDELEAQVTQLMAPMNPSFFHSDAEHHELIVRFLGFGGVSVAMADGEIDGREVEVLERIVAHSFELDEEAAEMLHDPDALDERLDELGQKLSMRLPVQQCQKLIEDLTAIALADKKLHEAEIDTLSYCAEALGLDRVFVERTLARVSQSLD